MAAMTRRAGRVQAVPREVGSSVPRPDRVAHAGAVRVTIPPAMAHLDLAPTVVGSGADGADGTPRTAGILVDGVPTAASIAPVGADRLLLVAGGELEADRHAVLLGKPDHGPWGPREVVVDGWRFLVEVEPERRASLLERARRGRATGPRAGPAEIRAMIPGRVLSVTVAAGDDVVAGDQLLVVEAMKMQNELRAPRDGRIERVAVGPGQTIELGDVLVVLG
jgi:biotin carboxyl carrier protein